MTIRTNRWLTSIFCAAFLLSAQLVSAATITIINNDGAGEGFNDPAARAPVGGNPGVTLGDQRMNVFLQAATIWGSILPSTVTILVQSQFNPQACDASSAVLGSAGPTTIHRDFAGAIVAGHWYHQALANKLSGIDLAAANPDINATFNSQLDTGVCLGGLVWYYGFDGNEAPNVELLPVVLHEMGHGLGFSTVTSGSTGNFNGGFPAIWDKFLFDDTAGLHWDQMTALQRQASAINNLNLVWDGPATFAAAPSILGHLPQLTINSPPGIAGTYSGVSAQFGAPLSAAGVTGDVVLVSDAGGASTSDGCEAISNVAGKVALIDRGSCTFVLKAQNAQAGGAIAVIITNNAPGLPPNPMAGSDPTLTIPVIGISQADGNLIKANLVGGVNAKVGAHPTQLTGSDAAGRPQMYAPPAFTGGSSVSHWDVGHTPNTLMEPFINTDLHNTVDLTRFVFADIGWDPAQTAIALSLFSAEGRSDGVFLRWLFADLTDVGMITLQRAASADGPWSPIQTEVGGEAGVTTALDMSAQPGRTYFYRLQVTDRQGHVTSLGRVSAQPMAGSLVLSAPAPNPMSRQSLITFRIGRPQYVRLAVTDVSGRKIRTLREGMMAPGEYSQMWNGEGDRAGRVSAGMYFLTLSTDGESRTQRIAVMD